MSYITKCKAKIEKTEIDGTAMAIFESVLHKVIHVCSVHFMKGFFYESQKPKLCLLNSKLRHLLLRADT